MSDTKESRFTSSMILFTFGFVLSFSSSSCSCSSSCPSSSFSLALFYFVKHLHTVIIFFVDMNALSTYSKWKVIEKEKERECVSNLHLNPWLNSTATERNWSCKLTFNISKGSCIINDSSFFICNSHHQPSRTISIIDCPFSPSSMSLHLHHFSVQLYSIIIIIIIISLKEWNKSEIKSSSGWFKWNIPLCHFIYSEIVLLWNSLSAYVTSHDLTVLSLSLSFSQFPRSVSLHLHGLWIQGISNSQLKDTASTAKTSATKPTKWAG